ncbi:unnamed protein product [Mytilus coruscus]|uniref:Uncharacterized protein n=1 Tax=Mytilus coruscus TaxID=42192 RepID=A0A6J8D9K0_MYTCO|nr:unnamed protein product [Mytilus coruscus]
MHQHYQSTRSNSASALSIYKKQQCIIIINLREVTVYQHYKSTRSNSLLTLSIYENVSPVMNGIWCTNMMFLIWTSLIQMVVFGKDTSYTGKPGMTNDLLSEYYLPHIYEKDDDWFADQADATDDISQQLSEQFKHFFKTYYQPNADQIADKAETPIGMLSNNVHDSNSYGIDQEVNMRENGQQDNSENEILEGMSLNNTDEMNDSFNIPLMFGDKNDVLEDELFQRYRRSANNRYSKRYRSIVDSLGRLRRVFRLPTQRRGFLDPIASHLIG